jgi:hypothetical protein
MRLELENLGYSRKQIEEIIQKEVSKRARKKNEENEEASDAQQDDKLVRENKVPKKNNRKDEQDRLKDRLEKIGFSGKNLDLKFRELLRLSENRREIRLKKMESEYQKTKWIKDRLALIEEVLDKNSWKKREKDKRLAIEKTFYEKCWENIMSQSSSEKDKNELLEEERGDFESSLAKNYLDVAIKDLKLTLYKETRKRLLEYASEYLELNTIDRQEMVQEKAMKFQLELIEERQKKFEKASLLLVDRLRSEWADVILPMEDRKKRKEDLNLLCVDLSSCTTKYKFNKVLDKYLKNFRRTGYYKKELKIIEQEMKKLHP